MYIGKYEGKLEAKNRVALPSRFRKQIGKNLLIANWFEQSIVILKPDEVELFVTELKEGSVLDPKIRDLERFLFGGMVEVTCDAQGRFVIPDFLKLHAGLEKSIVFVGVRRHIELWDLKRWDSYYQMANLQARNTAEQLIKK